MMLDRKLVKELDHLRKKLTDLNDNITTTTDECQKRNRDYTLAKKENQKLLRRVFDIGNEQEVKLSDLDEQIENLEMKLGVLTDEMNELKATAKENAFEVEKVRAEVSETKRVEEKRIAEMKEEFEEAKADLREERDLELGLIKERQQLLLNAKREYDKNLKDAEQMYEERYKKAEARYKAAEQPLLEKLKSLDYEIWEIKRAISLKPEEMQNLRAQNEALLKKLKKIRSVNLSDESKITARAVGAALKYVEEHPRNTTGDLILGVLIARANVQWILNTLKHRSGSQVWNNELEDLLRQCNRIIESNKSNTLRVPLLRSHLWEGAAGDLKFGTLKESDGEFVLPKFDSCESINAYMLNGSPEDSDLCINELIKSKCNVSEKCWLAELNGDDHSGYKTSHRLLYFQVAQKMECDKSHPEKFSVATAVKNKLCQKMLLEANALSEESHFSLTRDLFMEQIALCGLEGHGEFALEIWRNRVRNWQSAEGCFGQDVDWRNCWTSRGNDLGKKMKRGESEGCLSHVTAVGISALAFFLRATLNTASILF